MDIEEWKRMSRKRKKRHRLIKNGWVKNERLTKLALRKMEDHNIWPEGKFLGVYISKRYTRRLGTCWEYNGDVVIVMGQNTLDKYKWEFVQKIVLHEVIHIKVPNHSPTFKRIARTLGATEWAAIPREVSRRWRK